MEPRPLQYLCTCSCPQPCTHRRVSSGCWLLSATSESLPQPHRRCVPIVQVGNLRPNSQGQPGAEAYARASTLPPGSLHAAAPRSGEVLSTRPPQTK